MILSTTSKPFLKWAGGKTQLIDEIKKNLPKEVNESEFTYIEPFVGGGAILFWLLSNFSNLKKAIISDINKDLIDTYKIIANNPKELISTLEMIQKEFHNLEEDEEEKKIFYYKNRELFNSRELEKVKHAALFIFLNKTCFNGLYRVNNRNEFNVPIGKYKNPTICDKENILAVSQALQKVEIMHSDFEQTINFVNKNTFFYFDPPYKPLNETSKFNSYAKDEFDDNEQIRLKNFCDKVHSLNHSWILSNSDMKNQNINDEFFDDLYHNFNIQRIQAKRNINSNAQKRGEITELLIKNY